MRTLQTDTVLLLQHGRGDKITMDTSSLFMMIRCLRTQDQSGMRAVKCAEVQDLFKCFEFSNYLHFPKAVCVV